jgi:hypothetical protein
MEAVRSFEKLVNLYRTTPRYIPECIIHHVLSCIQALENVLIHVLYLRQVILSVMF